jgi:hypothetical protein
LFAFFFLLTFWRPVWVETYAASFIEHEVASKVGQRIDALGFEGVSVTLSKVDGSIYRKNQQRIDAYQLDLKSRANTLLADCIARILALDNAARVRLAQVLDAGALEGINSLTAVNARLTDLIQGNYLRVVAGLKHDLRIFTATNCACFLLLLMATCVRPEALRQLFIPAYLLLAATLSCSYACSTRTGC